MLIDFSKMETETIPNFMGGEGELHAKMHVDERNRILHGILPPGSSIGYITPTRPAVRSSISCPARAR